MRNASRRVELGESMRERAKAFWEMSLAFNRNVPIRGKRVTYEQAINVLTTLQFTQDKVATRAAILIEEIVKGQVRRKPQQATVLVLPTQRHSSMVVSEGTTLIQAIA